MSGHSKWNNIAKRKGANDAKKAAIFTKIGRKMAVAIKEGGSNNPDNNAKLRDCIAEAKANNVPNDNIKRMLDKGNQSNAGCVSWQFEQKGVLIIERGDLDEDETMMTVLDAGADDFQADEDCFQIYTAPEDFSAVRDALTEAGFEFAQAEIQMVPQNTITLESQEDMAQLRKLLDSLEDNDDVQHVWHNWENEDDYEE